MLKKRVQLSVDSIAIFVFLFGLFFKQFYLFSSGTLQIGDALMIIGSIIYLVQRKITIKKNDILFLFFVLSIIIINVIYAIIYSQVSFIFVCLYYIYVMIIFFAFSKMITSIDFAKKTAIVLKLVIVTQAIIYISRLGKWYEGVRYMGSFNDPNQYCFYLFSSSLVVLLISKYANLKYASIWVIISFVLVLPSASTGALLGYAFLFVFGVFVIDKERGALKALYLLLVFTVIVVIVLIGTHIITMPKFILNSNMFARINNKLVLFDTFDLGPDSIFAERGWDRIIKYPTVLLYGSGEAMLSRFGGSNMEIHSSVLAPLFYYGIVPFISFAIWYINRLIKIRTKYIFIYIALLAESMVLNNLRQPLFWMLLAMMSCDFVINEEEYLED